MAASLLLVSFPGIDSAVFSTSRRNLRRTRLSIVMMKLAAPILSPPGTPGLWILKPRKQRLVLFGRSH